MSSAFSLIKKNSEATLHCQANLSGNRNPAEIARPVALACCCCCDDDDIHRHGDNQNLADRTRPGCCWLSGFPDGYRVRIRT